MDALPRIRSEPLAHESREDVAREPEQGFDLARALPWMILAGLGAASLVTVIAQAGNYGTTVDEQLQQHYGALVLHWYVSHGRDTSFLTYYVRQIYMPEHGGVFDAGVAWIQSQTPHTDPLLVRHITTGLVGWLGAVLIAFCGYEVGGPWVGLVAALGLWLYPRYYGAIYNNPKDIPATVSLILALWMTLLLVKHWRSWAWVSWLSVLMGLALGAATAIRVTALVWFAILAALAAGWWAINGLASWRERRLRVELARQGLAASLIAVAWGCATIALWPWVFLNPVTNLVESFQVMSHYPWSGTTLFEGLQYPASHLPANYVAVWLVIGSPPLLLALILMGAAVAVAEVVVERSVRPAVAVVALASVIPLAALQLARPTLYDGLRQFLFVLPPLILLAAYGLVRVCGVVWRERRAGLRWMVAGLVVVTLANYALVIADMASLSPYEYTYFSPVIGGLPGAAGSYETDYYGTCDKAAAEWLAQNYTRYTDARAPTFDASDLLSAAIKLSLPAAFRQDTKTPQFFIGFTRFGDDQRYPAYRVIHVVSNQGVRLCVVKVNPNASNASNASNATARGTLTLATYAGSPAMSGHRIPSRVAQRLYWMSRPTT